METAAYSSRFVMGKEKMVWIALGLIAAAAIAYIMYGQGKQGGEAVAPTPGGTVCTMEAKQCPDGSYVGRGGPNCEFAPCPGPDVKVEVK